LHSFIIKVKHINVYWLFYGTQSISTELYFVKFNILKIIASICRGCASQ